MIDEAKEYERIINFMKLTVDESIIRGRYQLYDDDIKDALDVIRSKKNLAHGVHKFLMGTLVGKLIASAAFDPKFAVFSLLDIPASLLAYILYRKQENMEICLVKNYAFILQKVSEDVNNFVYKFDVKDPKQLKTIKAFMDEYDAMTKEEQQKLIADMLTPNDVDSDNDIEVDEEKEMND